MRFKDDRPAKISKVALVATTFVVLCGFSFYLGGIFYSEKNGLVTNDIRKSVESPRMTESTSVQVKFVSFPQCKAKLQDYTPCTDPKVLHLVG